MTSSCRFPSLPARWLALPFAALLGAAALGAPAQDNAAARYQRERARCASGQSQEDRATCLREAGAALDEARRGRLDNGQEGQYRQNALQRCNALPESERADCVGRIQEGNVSGSVGSGGVLREYSREIPADAGSTGAAR